MSVKTAPVILHEMSVVIIELEWYDIKLNIIVYVLSNFISILLQIPPISDW